MNDIKHAYAELLKHTDFFAVIGFSDGNTAGMRLLFLLYYAVYFCPIFGYPVMTIALPPLYMWMLVPACVSLAGGILAAFWQPSQHARSLIQHFAAGVVLAALSVEVLPEIGRGHSYGPYLLGAFAVGALCMFGLKLWSQRLERKALLTATVGLNVGFISAAFIDIAMDGFIIGAGFAAGGSTGAILAIGLSVELLFLGMSLISDQLKGGKIVIVTAALGATVLGCTLLGYHLLAQASHVVISTALAFSAAALLYLVTEELLIEAHEVEEKPIATLVLFSGFLVFWAISLLG